MINNFAQIFCAPLILLLAFKEELVRASRRNDRGRSINNIRTDRSGNTRRVAAERKQNKCFFFIFLTLKYG